MGHDLQMDMWNKTNYGAQMQHIKDAGLNPALMYGMSGGGGVTTGSQSGGSAASGSAEQMRPMDLGNALIGAQIKDLEASANLKDDQGNKLKNVDTKEAESRIGEIEARTENEKVKKILVEIQTDIEEIRKANTQREYDANIGKTEQELRRLSIGADLDLETFDAVVEEAAGNAVLAWKNVGLIDSKTELSDTQINEIQNKIQQAWTGLDIQAGQLNEKTRNNLIQEMKLQLDEKLTGMKLDNDMKISIMRSATSIITSLIGGVSNIKAKQQ
jgi:hypothetical protein